MQRVRRDNFENRFIIHSKWMSAIFKDKPVENHTRVFSQYNIILCLLRTVSVPQLATVRPLRTISHRTTPGQLDLHVQDRGNVIRGYRDAVSRWRLLYTAMYLHEYLAGHPTETDTRTADQQQQHPPNIPFTRRTL